MLIRYKKSCEKIAMGLLSLMPKEKNIKHLCHTMELYETDPDWQLYLLKRDEAFIGLIGLEIGEDAYTIRHISVLPPFRGEGRARYMIEKVQLLMPNRSVQSTAETEAIVAHCMENKLAHN
ncbi:GNAT family N-acetyltransferase [Planococcus sp. FY231025]|uniref:GNAT family N-acetyltransferase n=1 Tax=Planococcus sp. FY231025 TaxID=3455699 RepID=UPI003F9185E2